MNTNQESRCVCTKCMRSRYVRRLRPSMQLSIFEPIMYDVWVVIASNQTDWNPWMKVRAIQHLWVQFRGAWQLLQSHSNYSNEQINNGASNYEFTWFTWVEPRFPSNSFDGTCKYVNRAESSENEVHVDVRVGFKSSIDTSCHLNMLWITRKLSHQHLSNGIWNGMQRVCWSIAEIFQFNL